MNLYRVREISRVGSRQPDPSKQPEEYYHVRLEQSDVHGKTVPATEMIISASEEEVGAWRVGGLYDFSKVEAVPIVKHEPAGK